MQAILVAMVVHRCNTKHFAQCSMSRAIPKATGCCHRATICSVLPQHLPGQQQTKQQQNSTPTLLTVLMAMAMHWYITAHIAQWRRSRASLEATGRRHWASICSNSSNQSFQNRLFLSVFMINSLKMSTKQNDGPI